MEEQDRQQNADEIASNDAIALDEDSPSDAAGWKRRQLPKIVLGTALVLALIGGLYWWWLLRTTVSTDNAKVAGDLVDLSFTSAGRIQSIEVQEGETVDVDQIVAQQDNSSQNASVQQAQASLDLARANEKRLPYDQESLEIAVEKSEAGVSSANTGVEAAEAGVKNASAGVEKADAQVQVAQEAVTTAQIALDDAKRNYDNNQMLFTAGAVSEENLKQARSRYETAEAAYNTANSNLVAAQASHNAAAATLESAEVGVETAANGVATAAANLADSQQKLEASQETAGDIMSAQVKAAMASLEAAKITLDKTILRSPLKGVVLRIAVLEGESVSASQTVVTIADLEHTYIQANLEEKYISRIVPGQDVDVEIDAYPGMAFKGKVAEIWEASQSTFAIISGESTSGNFTKVAQRIPVKIDVDSQGKVLKPGMSAVVTIHTP